MKRWLWASIGLVCSSWLTDLTRLLHFHDCGGDYDLWSLNIFSSNRSNSCDAGTTILNFLNSRIDIEWGISSIANHWWLMTDWRKLCDSCCLYSNCPNLSYTTLFLLSLIQATQSRKMSVEGVSNRLYSYIHLYTYILQKFGSDWKSPIMLPMINSKVLNSRRDLTRPDRL